MEDNSINLDNLTYDDYLQMEETPSIVLGDILESSCIEIMTNHKVSTFGLNGEENYFFDANASFSNSGF